MVLELSPQKGHNRSLLVMDFPVCCGRANDEPNRARRSSSDDGHDIYDCGTTDNTVQFNIKEEAAERAELAVSGHRVAYLSRVLVHIPRRTDL